MEEHDLLEETRAASRTIEGQFAEEMEVARPIPEAIPRPTDWWRCARQGPVSGRYQGEMTWPTAGRYELDLRIDIEPRQYDSPVINRISGDLYRVYRFHHPSFPYPLTWRVYQESWVVDTPTENWSRCQVELAGTVRYWTGTHPAAVAQIRIPWSSFKVAGPAEVAFCEANDTSVVLQRYSCKRTSSYFRDLNLEVDLTQSVDGATHLPWYDTHAHSIRPPGLRRRTLSIEKAFEEAGISVNLRPHNVIDDSTPDFTSWSVSELHDAMEVHFSQIDGSWPRWELWGMLAGQFDDPGVAGIMFDAAAAFGGAGRAPERQGFTVFHNHPWFDKLPDGPPTNDMEAAALRQYLYTWVHEVGHAFNFLHSWDKGRPTSLSWMNYDWRYDALEGPGSFWQNFEMRFDDEELAHIRHGDRATVIMGGDPWGSGGHIETPPNTVQLDIPSTSLFQLKGEAPLELMLRSKGYYTFLEPVEIELRLRNLLDDVPFVVDTRLDPSFGSVLLHIRRPDGKIMPYAPILCQLGIPELRTLQPKNSQQPGADRYSQEVFLSYGKYGFYFDEPGEYLIRAIYQGLGNILIPSNTLQIRVGHPQSEGDDRLAQDYFSYEVGMMLYLDGSKSPSLKQGREVLRELTNRHPESPAGVKAATVLAESEGRSFFQVQQRDTERAVLTKIHDANPEEALKLTQPALAFYQHSNGTGAKSLNLDYHGLVRNRAKYLVALGEKQTAKQEIMTLRDNLAARDVNQPVLNEITNYAEKIERGESE